MNAMEILNRCRSAAGEIERLDQRIARYRACATDSSARIGRVGCAQGTACDPVSQFAVEIADCRQQRDQRQREYMAENYCACKLLDTLPETECAILYRYYLARKTVGEIACSLHFTVNYVTTFPWVPCRQRTMSFLPGPRPTPKYWTNGRKLISR